MIKDLRITVRKLIETIPDVSKTSIDNLLIDHLGYVKVRASGKLKNEVLSYLCGASGDFYALGIKNTVHCMQKCIDLNDDSVKK